MKTDLPIISVIIPSYNHANYVADAIYSVIEQQSDKFKLDLVVVDDGSTDNSISVIERIKRESDFPFLLIKKENEGVCRTLNLAIRKYAKGEYIAILASDDYWAPLKLEKQLECLDCSVGSDLNYCNAIKFGVKKKTTVAQRMQFSGRVKNLLTLFNFVPAGTVLYRREIFDRIGGYDETGLKLEDWDFLLRASNVTKFSRLKESLLYYRVHDNSSIARMRVNGTLFSEKYKVIKKNKSILNPCFRYLSLVAHYLLGVLTGYRVRKIRRKPS